MIPLCIPEIRGNEWKYVKDCLDTNWVSSVGSYVDKFEKDFATYVGAKDAVVTMNGTSALELALRTLGIGQGDEVIVSSMTFISPVNTIRYVGAEPVFVDVCRDSFVMDASKVEELITSKTKAIMPVHIYGHAVDMDVLIEVAKKHNLYIIEDATEALGSEYKGQKLGTLGDMGCFSFNGNKLITTGAGGMMVTNNDDYAHRAKYLSTQTKTTLDNGAFYHEEVGYNFRMPNVLAAMGVAQLEMVPEFVEIKRKNAKLYNELFADVKGITPVIERKDTINCYWLYSILVEDEFGISRDEVLKELNNKGVQARSFFMSVHEMPPYKECKHGNMNVTDEISAKGINLPSSVSLSSTEVNLVVEAIKQIGAVK